MAMRVAGFTHRRARVVGTGVIVAASIFVPSPLSPSIAAKPGPPTPFDSNGYDNSFAIAQSRPQGPLINEAEASQLREFDRKIMNIIDVDDFAPEELQAAVQAGPTPADAARLYVA